MAQSSSAMREPTMDEILTSIREIIEENTAQAAQLESIQSAAKVKPSVDHGVNTSLNSSLSVDDAMKALAARIGLSVGIETEQPSKDAEQNAETDIFGESRLNAASSQAIDKTKIVSETTASPSAANDIGVKKPLFLAEAESIAENELRPVLSSWLETQLPTLVEKILREEIAKILSGVELSNNR
ncbi:DUF2497 domain-containing protein [Bartonella sp. LJL80]